jgi:putative transcriptional regulator
MGTTLDIAIRLEELFNAPARRDDRPHRCRSTDRKPPNPRAGDVLVDPNAWDGDPRDAAAPFQALALFERHTS